MSVEIVPVDIDTLQETWALRGHPVLLRRRWAREGVDADSDESVRSFCAATDDLDLLIRMVVDFASMSEEPALNARADIAAERIAVLDPWLPEDEEATG
jgi:hypothetical protein